MPAGAPNEWLERGLDLGSLIWEVRALTQPSSTELSVAVAADRWQLRRSDTAAADSSDSLVSLVSAA